MTKIILFILITQQILEKENNLSSKNLRKTNFSQKSKEKDIEKDI